MTSSKDWRAANPERAKEHDRKYREKNKEKIRAKYQKWYRSNSDKVIKTSAEWAKANPEKKKKTGAKFYLTKGKAAMAKQRQEWRIFIDGVKLHYQCRNPNCQSPKNLPSYCFDFHHLADKAFNVSTQRLTKNTVIPEINKCTVLCSLCHRMVTKGDLDDTNFQRCNLNNLGEAID